MALPGTDVMIGVAFDGRASLDELREQARRAEAGGACAIWIACHLFLRDPISSALAALDATRHIRVVLMAMSPYTMHPTLIAMSTAALAEMHPGRVGLCLGVGAPGDLAAAGVAAERPLAALREAIAVCRSLLAGETIDHQGGIFKVSGRKLPNPAPDVPIMLAATGPQMLELAGAEADGVLISAATSVEFVRWALTQVERGAAGRRLPSPCTHHVIVYTRVADSERAALDSIRRTMAFVLRGAHHAKNVALAGTALDQGALAQAHRDGDWATVDQLVTDHVMQAHAAAGTDAQVHARYRDYAAIGVDELIVGGIDDAPSIARTLGAITGG